MAEGVSRRNFLKIVGGASAVGVAGGLGITKLLDSLEDIESVVNGRFLNRQEDGTLKISETPQVVEVKYTPHADLTSQYWNKNNIVVQRKPQADSREGQYIPSDEIKATHAIRVAGGTFGGQTKAARFEVSYKGQKYTIGEWFVPSDQQGNPVNPKGEPLREGEKPYFIAANFVTVEATESTMVK